MSGQGRITERNAGSWLERSAAAWREQACPAPLLLRGLLFGFGPSVASDAEEKVPTGGELTVFEAVGLVA